MDEEQWVAERAALRHLMTLHPTWTPAELAACLGRSKSWVKKWRTRFQAAAPDDRHVLFSQSRARRTPPPPPHPLLVQRILALRDTPPENLQRTPGPRALLYYLPRHAEGLPSHVALPRSTRTIWKILRQHGRIAQPLPRTAQRLDHQPMQNIQLDFKDASTVPADPFGKQQHVVETCHFFDPGSSHVLWAPVRDDFNAETALEETAQFLREQGVPPKFTFDRDPRWVGSASGRDFPSAFVRFLLTLHIVPNVCPPHRPDLNGGVERYQKTYKYECLLVHRPTSLAQVREQTAAFLVHYHTERPHQGRACNNVPPSAAFPTLPKLPPVPEQVNPDQWLETLNGQAFARKVGSDGCARVDNELYYISPQLAGQRVVLFINAPERVFDVYHGHQQIKQVPLKGLHGGEMSFDHYVTVMMQEARSEERRAKLARRPFQQPGLWA